MEYFDNFSNDRNTYGNGRNKCGNKNHNHRCEDRCRPNCMRCSIMRKPRPCSREICCNSYPEPVFDEECEDEFFICCY